MSTPTINLLPAARVRGIRARAAARWWGVGGIAYGAALFLGAGTYSVSVAREGGDDAHVVVAAARLEAARAEKQALGERVNDLRKRVDAARAVGHHPDWSVLLRHLAVSRPGTVVLEKCELKRVETTERAAPAGSSVPGTPAPAPRTRVRLEFVVSGTAAQLSDVHAFVGVVEECGVFDSVRLGETNTSDAVGTPGGGGGGQVTTFSVKCEAWEPDSAEGGQP